MAYTDIEEFEEKAYDTLCELTDGTKKVEDIESSLEELGELKSYDNGIDDGIDKGEDCYLMYKSYTLKSKEGFTLNITLYYGNYTLLCGDFSVRQD